MIELFVLPVSLILLAAASTTTKSAWITPEQAIREEAQLLKTAADILSVVNSRKSADIAIVQLRSLRKDASAYWENSVAASTVEPSEQRYHEGKAASDRFHSQVTRIKTVPGGSDVRQAIQHFWLALTRGCDSDEQLTWRWCNDKARFDYSRKQLPEYDVSALRGKYAVIALTFRHKSDAQAEWVHRLRLPYNAVAFARWHETLFLAEYCDIATGCNVRAIDLKSGKQQWTTRLFGTGPTPRIHSRYSNDGVNIETDGKRVIIHGNESDGKYVEHLEVSTGKTLANTRFEHEPR